MKFGIDEIKCPYCSFTREAEWDDTENGPNLSKHEECNVCGKYFILKSEMFSVKYSFESWTEDEYEKKLDREHESVMDQIKELKRRKNNE